jgi:hypothetical protein
MRKLKIDYRGHAAIDAVSNVDRRLLGFVRPDEASLRQVRHVSFDEGLHIAPDGSRILLHNRITIGG